MLAPIVASGHVVAQDDDPIIIGAPINLTGWMAAYDQPPLDGAQLAVEQINAAGGVLGRPLEIKVVDGKTDPATVGNAAIRSDRGAQRSGDPMRLRQWRANQAGRAGSRPGGRVVLRVVAVVWLGHAGRQAVHRFDVEPNHGRGRGDSEKGHTVKRLADGSDHHRPGE
ncbi:MAG: ABC transporter substrate-binding protein [Thermomicrobiales bacterium]